MRAQFIFLLPGYRLAEVGRWLLFVLMLGLASLAGAVETEALVVHGFGTLGAVRTTSDQVEFVRDLSQASGAGRQWRSDVDSLLGLQANWRLNDDLEWVIQGVSHHRYDGAFRPELSWAFVKYEPRPNLQMRAGRLGTEFFMLADSRQVGYSFLTVRPVGDFFWYLPFSSIHGGDVAMTVPLGEDLLRGKLFYGQAQGRLPLGSALWEIDGSPMGGGYLEYQTAFWQLRASYANIRFNHDLPFAAMLGSPLPAAVEQHLAMAGKRSDYYSLGAVYDRGPWQVQVMLNLIDQQSQAFQSSMGGYVLAGYRIDSVTPFAGLSRVYSKRRTDTMNSLLVGRLMADTHADQTTFILGMRWDVARHLALKAQLDAIRGDEDSILPYRNDPATGRWSGRMNVFSVSMDFLF